MENDILDSLEQLGYSGPLLQDGALLGAAEAGLGSSQLLELCVWLCSRLKELCGLEESITSGPAEEESLRLELSGLLKELHCPCERLLSGLLRGTTSSKDCLTCVLFLCSELQATQLLSNRGSSEKGPGVGPECEDVRSICETLKLSLRPEEGTNELLCHIHDKDLKLKAEDLDLTWNCLSLT